MKARHCGSCRHFTNEDINGDGWCEGCYQRCARCTYFERNRRP